MGQGEPNTVSRQHTSQDQRHVLDGSGAVCLTIWKLILEPGKEGNGATGRI